MGGQRHVKKLLARDYAASGSADRIVRSLDEKLLALNYSSKHQDTTIETMVPSAGSAVGMRSAVSWALLGIVIERPSYGYELAVRFERTYGKTLELSSRSHIYSALDSLTRRALVEEHTSPAPAGSARRHPKAHYKATAHGIDSHRQWLIGQLADQRRRSRLFTIQLAMLDPRAALELLDRYEHDTLQESTRPATSARGSSADGPERLAERLIAEEERLEVDAKLAWIEYARRELDALIQPDQLTR